MRKRIIDTSPATDHAWLDLENLATVEVSSEQSGFPAEAPFSQQASGGWKAAAPGEQKIRLVFDQPTDIAAIQLRFQESEHERTQEFALSYRSRGGDLREIARQQWNFSPSGSTEELENYAVQLSQVEVLELSVRPGNGTASLSHWRLR